MQKRIIVKKEITNSKKAEEIASTLNISPLVAGVLLNRGMEDVREIEEFLYGKAEPFYNPFLMKDMQKAVERIEASLAAGEKISVYGDYDVDGITATSLLYLYLQGRGAKVDVYIPKRSDEGYGLNHDAIRGLYENGTKLLVTVDCGISANAEVAAVPAGMDVIITDHHTPPEVLPAAYAIVNPHQHDCAYPFKELAGVGVAFKLCQALERRINPQGMYWQENLELVALGTVADIVPLLDENRELVRMGLKSLKQTKNLGLLELIKIADLGNRPLNSESIGFGLAPRLNAAGRLEHALSAVRLLTTNDVSEAEVIAEQLNEENTIRQAISKKIFHEAEEILSRQEKIDTAIVLAKDDWHPGVVGIVASRLVEKYHLPTILITVANGEAKGSCRSIPPLNLYDALASCKDYLQQFGGHHQAAGLTLKSENIEAFRTAFRAQVKSMLSPEDYISKVTPDYLVPEDRRIGTRTVKDLSLMEPYGAANPFPIFAFAGARISHIYLMGKEKNHLKIFLHHGNNIYKAVIWNEADNLPAYYLGEKADFAFAPKLNVFSGEESVDLHISAVEPRRNIVDMRNTGESKIRKLRGIIQQPGRTVVYVHNSQSRVPVIDEKDVLIYGDTLPQDARNVVFYDVPPTVIFSEKYLPIKQYPNVTLYLLYDKQDAERVTLSILRRYPDKIGMAESYRYLSNLLKSQSVVKLNVLLNHSKTRDCYFTEEIIRIFKELNFIKVEDGQVSMFSRERNELQNSATYRHIVKEREKRMDNLRQVMIIAPEMIAEIW